MAGVKGKSGGARTGAGRKRKDRPHNETPKKIENIEEVYEEIKTCDIAVGDFPKELEGIPYTKDAWDYALNIDKLSTIHLLNARHYEALKGYCLAVAQRRLLVEKWKAEGFKTLYEDDRHNIKIHPLMKEIDNMNKRVGEQAEALGLTVLGEYKLAKTVKSSPNLTGDSEQLSEDSDLF